MLELFGPSALDLKDLAVIRVLHGLVVEVEQLLGLLHHVLEEGDGAHFEITLHLVDLAEG